MTWEEQDYLVLIKSNAQKGLQTWLKASPKHRKPGVHGGCNVLPHIGVGNNYFPLSHNAKQHVKWSCQFVHRNQILTKQHTST